MKEMIYYSKGMLIIMKKIIKHQITLLKEKKKKKVKISILIPALTNKNNM